MARATESIYHGKHYSLVRSTSYLNLLVKLLVEDKVFEFKVGHSAKWIKFINLYMFRVISRLAQSKMVCIL